MFSPFLSLLFSPQKNWLVVTTPLQNMKDSWDDYSQYMEKYRTCSKPPTRSYGFPMVFQTTNQKKVNDPRFSATNPASAGAVSMPRSSQTWSTWRRGSGAR
jgi:hypothetical protein